MVQYFAFAMLTLSACGGKERPTRGAAPRAAMQSVDHAGHAQHLVKKNIIVDGHIDLPYRLHKLKEEGKESPDLSVQGEEGDFDAVRAKLGGLNAPFMSIYIPSKYQEEGGAKKLADELIDSVEEIVKKWPQDFALASNPSQIKSNFSVHKISLLMGIENGAAVESDIGNVEYFFKRGVRYMTLTHAKDNLICDSSYDDKHRWGGLSPYGRQVVAEMNRLGMLVDVSHVSDQSFYDVMKVSTKPVIASHSSLRHFTPGFERNMNDEMVKALAQNGGVIMINFGSTFLSQTSIDWSSKYKELKAKTRLENKKASEKEIEALLETWTEANPFPYASVEDVADHIDRVSSLAGVEHVGLGSDFDGVGDSLPVELKDASDYPNLIRVLLERGYSDSDIEKICSGNLLRVWSAQNNSH